MDGIAFICPADFHLAARKLCVFSDAEDDARPHFSDIRVGGKEGCLFFRNIPKRSLGVVSGLAEGHLYDIFAHALGQRKELSLIHIFIIKNQRLPGDILISGKLADGEQVFHNSSLTL